MHSGPGEQTAKIWKKFAQYRCWGTWYDRRMNEMNEGWVDDGWTVKGRQRMGEFRFHKLWLLTVKKKKKHCGWHQEQNPHYYVLSFLPKWSRYVDTMESCTIVTYFLSLSRLTVITSCNTQRLPIEFVPQLSASFTKHCSLCWWELVTQWKYLTQVPPY